MHHTTKQSLRPSARTIAFALIAGFAVVVLLFPGSGNAAQPPTCYSLLGYVVPCDAWVAWAAGAATAVLVGSALRINERRNAHSDDKMAAT